jgi:Flp pilus assembly protein TadB
LSAIAGPLWLLPGAAAGLVIAAALGRLEPAGVARRRRLVGRDLPVAVDLLAACAQAGLPLNTSLVVVGRAVGGPLAQEFADIDARVRLGSDPTTEWRRIATDPQLGSLARAVLRSLESGASIVDGLQRLAADQRRQRRVDLQVRARSVGVRSAAPLAGCFLPAFMLIGVVPTVIGGFVHLVLS